MADIIVELTERLREDYRKLPEHLQTKLKKQLRFLMANARHPSMRVHPIRGSDSYEGFYVDDPLAKTGDYRKHRCVFRREGNVYYLFAVGQHKVVDEFARK